MERYRIQKIGFGFYVQRYSKVMLDGIPDYIWKDLKRFDTKAEALSYIMTEKQYER